MFCSPFLNGNIEWLVKYGLILIDDLPEPVCQQLEFSYPPVYFDLDDSGPQDWLTMSTPMKDVQIGSFRICRHTVYTVRNSGVLPRQLVGGNLGGYDRAAACISPSFFSGRDTSRQVG